MVLHLQSSCGTPGRTKDLQRLDAAQERVVLYASGKPGLVISLQYPISQNWKRLLVPVEGGTAYIYRMVTLKRSPHIWHHARMVFIWEMHLFWGKIVYLVLRVSIICYEDWKSGLLPCHCIISTGAINLGKFKKLL